MLVIWMSTHVMSWGTQLQTDIGFSILKVRNLTREVNLLTRFYRATKQQCVNSHLDVRAYYSPVLSSTQFPLSQSASMTSSGLEGTWPFCMLPDSAIMMHLVVGRLLKKKFLQIFLVILSLRCF